MKTSIILLLLIMFTTPVFSEISVNSYRDNQDWIIEFSNMSNETYEAMIISADPAYQSEIGQLLIESEKKMVIRFNFTGEGEINDEPVYIRLISDHIENPGLVTLGATEELPQLINNDSGIVLEYYYTPTCSSCREFLEKEIPEIEKTLNLQINIKNIDITKSDGLIQMNKRLSSLGSSEKKLPMIIAGNYVLAGDQKIENELKNLLIKISREELREGTSSTISGDSGYISLQVLPIFLAGLLDGINPCAFSTLIFLLSWLTLAGRNKKEILLTGIFFSSTVFITYYTIGLGSFAALRTSESVPIISWILKYSMALILLVLCVIHLFDYRKVKQGRLSEMTLQLSKERKKKIHSLIRGKARQTGLFAGSIVLGLLVTIYELGCTGQVYLPTLMYMVKIEKEISSFLLLGIYNLGFIIPLIILFIAAWRGLGSEKLTIWFKDNLALVKLLSAAFFLLMAILLIFT